MGKDKMVNKEEMILYVRMFGGFAMRYGKKVISFNRIRSSKSVRLLQMLFLSVPDGISKDELIDYLYKWNGETGSADYNNTLNVLLHRLKKQLTAAGLPEREYIEIQDGVCRFQSEIPLEIDVWQFERAVEKAGQISGGTDRIKLLLKANELYCGELLPANQSDLWFFQKSNYYKKLFLETVAELEEYYLREKDMQGLLDLYTRTASIYPFENWQTKQIRCNVAMYRYEEALKIYQDTMELYAKEIGSEPPAELHECFADIEPTDDDHKNYMRSPHGWKDMDRIFWGKKNNIWKALFGEENEGGAYYCNYPSFVDYCHLMARSEERTKVSVMLMFLTLSRKEEKQQKEMNLPEEMEKLKEIIGVSLRKGDAYTRYGSRHFILMLTGVTMEFCGVIFRRIEKAYVQCGKGILWYYADMTQELSASTE